MPKLSAEDRKRIASLGGQARRESLEAARRIADNFRYVAAVNALRGDSVDVKRERTFTGRLPGIYLDGRQDGRHVDVDAPARRKR